MSGEPCEALGGQTSMQVAKKPIMDMLASKSTVGTVLNVPPEMVPESDTANLSVLSYDPLIYSKGRSPLEAASIGITLGDNDTAFRCNLVTLSEDTDVYDDRIMIDHGADNITTKEAAELVEALKNSLDTDGRVFYTGTSYRESMIVTNAPEKVEFSRPHDIKGLRIGDYMPEGEDGEYYADLMRRSFEILNNHPINVSRREKGLNPANSVWFWSPGKRAALPSFKEKWSLNATMISAVDLLKGIGYLAGMDIPEVKGATGTLDTNYAGKAEAAIKAFENGKDFVYIHVEATDECGHQKDHEGKVKAIENIDALILAPLFDYLSVCGDSFKILLLPDHPTPLNTGRHSHEPVPFFIYSSTEEVNGPSCFCEETAFERALYIPKGQSLLSLIIEDSGKKNPPAEKTDSDCNEESAPVSDAHKKKKDKAESTFSGARSSVFVDIAEVFVIALVCVLVLMTFFIRHSPVSGQSMAPTLNGGDILIVSDFLYTPKRGDIVIIQVDKTRGGVTYTSKERPLVKRVIALGGDTVKINFTTWEIKVNGEIIDQSYLGEDYNSGHVMNDYLMEPDENGICELTVSEGCVFALGDNRNDSLDCRTIGEIDERCIVGKVIFRVLPISKIGIPD